jgi:CDGSH-type Zn-finger protein
MLTVKDVYLCNISFAGTGTHTSDVSRLRSSRTSSKVVRMKGPVLLLVMSLSMASAFTRRSVLFSQRAFSLATGRINTQIDVDSPKVVHTIEVCPTEKFKICRCWKSAKFPLCDGAHIKHNQETKDNIAPCIILGVEIFEK